MTTAPARAAPVGAAGLVVPADSGVVTVTFDGRRVWSLRPDLDGERVAAGWFVPWPPALASYLHGSTRVRVAGFDDGRTYAEEELAFDDRGGRVRVVDSRGNPLVVNKVGTLSRAFDATDETTRHEILTGTARILADLHDAGVPAYLCYGALLGAVRDGQVIGHDCDTDLCYLSDHREPVDVIAESYQLERVLRTRGWTTTRMSGADFKVRLVLSDGRSEQVDVFAAFHVGHRFFQLGNRSGALTREDIVPTSTVELEGVTFPAPARPERMLEFLYGPRWRMPDPSFRYDDPVDGVRRLDGWLRGFRVSSRGGTATGPPPTPARCRTGVRPSPAGSTRGCPWSGRSPTSAAATAGTRGSSPSAAATSVPSTARPRPGSAPAGCCAARARRTTYAVSS